MISNKKLHPVVTELFISGWKLNISSYFLLSYFVVPKVIRLNTAHFFIMKFLTKREPQQIAIKHSSDISFDEFKRPYRNFNEESYSFLVIGTTLPSDNPFHFHKDLLQWVQGIIMNIDDKISDERLQYDINRQQHYHQVR